MRLVIYLDDIIILKETKEGTEKDFKTAVNLLEKCGFLVNMDKSMGVGTQSIAYLGLVLDSNKLSLSLRDDKILSIRKLCNEILDSKFTSLREIAKILGNFVWAVQAVPYAQSHYRALQKLYITESAK